MGKILLAVPLLLWLMLTPNFSVPGVIIIDILSSIPLEVYLGIVLLLVLLIASFTVPSWFGKHLSSARDIQRLSTVQFEPRKVMSPREAFLYNALHLVVRDRFLLLAKVPLRNLIQMREGDRKARRALVMATRNVLADFVLLHPGSLIPEKVIFFDAGGGPRSPTLPDASVLDFLGRAGIGIARLSSQKPYTVDELTEILELGEEG